MSTKTRLDSHFHKLDLLFFGARGWLLGTGASSAREVGFFNALFSGGAVPDDARNAPFIARACAVFDLAARWASAPSKTVRVVRSSARMENERSEV